MLTSSHKNFCEQWDSQFGAGSWDLTLAAYWENDKLPEYKYKLLPLVLNMYKLYFILWQKRLKLQFLV